MSYRNLNLNQLLIFHTAANLKSFTAAADKLFLTQPGISKHIKCLETFYKTKLFERIGKKIELTDAGVILFKKTKKIFFLLDEAKDEINDLLNLKRGNLKIHTGFTTGLYIIPEIMKKFKTKYPDINFYFDISLTKNIIDKVINNLIDIGIIAGECNNPNIESIKFLEDELVLIIPKDHRLNNLKIIHIEELQDETILLSKKGSATREKIEIEFKKYGISLNNIIEFGNPLAIKKGVEAGLGISIMSKYILSKNEISNIRLRKINNLSLKRNFNIIIHKEKYLSNTIKEFLDMLINEKTNYELHICFLNF